MKHHARKCKDHVVRFKHHYGLATLIVALGYGVYYIQFGNTNVSAAPGTQEIAIVDAQDELEVSGNPATPVGIKLISPANDSLEFMKVQINNVSGVEKADAYTIVLAHDDDDNGDFDFGSDSLMGMAQVNTIGAPVTVTAGEITFDQEGEINGFNPGAFRLPSSVNSNFNLYVLVFADNATVGDQFTVTIPSAQDTYTLTNEGSVASAGHTSHTVTVIENQGGGGGGAPDPSGLTPVAVGAAKAGQGQYDVLSTAYTNTTEILAWSFTFNNDDAGETNFNTVAWTTGQQGVSQYWYILADNGGSPDVNNVVVSTDEHCLYMWDDLQDDTLYWVAVASEASTTVELYTNTDGCGGGGGNRDISTLNQVQVSQLTLNDDSTEHAYSDTRDLNLHRITLGSDTDDLVFNIDGNVNGALNTNNINIYFLSDNGGSPDQVLDQTDGVCLDVASVVGTVSAGVYWFALESEDTTGQYGVEAVQQQGCGGQQGGGSISYQYGTPEAGSTDVSVQTPLNGGFGEALNTNTVTTQSVGLFKDGNFSNPNLCTSVTTQSNDTEIVCNTAGDLEAATFYMLIFGPSIANTNGDSLSATETINFQTSDGAFKIDSFSPEDKAKDVSVTGSIQVSFTNGLVDSNTLDGSSVKLYLDNGAGQPIGDNLCTSFPTVGNGTGVSCGYEGELQPSTDYIFQIENTIQSTDTNSLQSSGQITFQTAEAPAPDNDATAVSDTSINDGASGVFIDQNVISVVFDGTIEDGEQNLGTDEIQLFELTGEGGAPTGSNLCSSVGSSNGANAQCTVNGDLQTNTYYRFSWDVDSTDGETTLIGQIEFRTNITGTSNDSRPRIVFAHPPAGGINVPLDAPLIVGFSQDMVDDAGKSTGITNFNNILLYKTDSSGQLTGADLINDQSAVLEVEEGMSDAEGDVLVVKMNENLDADTEYALLIRGDVASNQGGGSMQNDVIRFFRTGDTVSSETLTLSSFPQDGMTIPRTLSGFEVFSFNKIAGDTVSTPTAKLFADANANSMLDGGELVATDVGLVELDYDEEMNVIRYSAPGILPQGMRMCFLILAGGIEDEFGNQLDEDWVSCFTTEDVAYTAVAPELMWGEFDQFSGRAKFSGPVDDDDVTGTTTWTFTVNGEDLTFENIEIDYFPERFEVEFRNITLEPGVVITLTATGIYEPEGSEAMVEDGIVNVAEAVVKTGGDLLTHHDHHTQTDFSTFNAAPIRGEPYGKTAGETSRWRFELPIEKDLAAGSQIIVNFPLGTELSGASVSTNKQSSFHNANLKGHGEPTTIDSGSVNENARTFTIVTAGEDLEIGDHVIFEIDGIENSSVAGQEYNVQFQIINDSGQNLGTVHAAPFVLYEGGDFTLGGYVYADDNNNGVRDAGEGVNKVKVFCHTSFGQPYHDVASTDVNGYWELSNIAGDSDYQCGLEEHSPALAGRAVHHGHNHVVVTDQSKTNVHFRVSSNLSSGNNPELTVSVNGPDDLADETVFVRCNVKNFSDFAESITLDATGDGEAAFHVPANSHVECFAEPYIDPSVFTNGGDSISVETSFLSSRAEVEVESEDVLTGVTLTYLDSYIPVKAIDKDGTAVGNVMVGMVPQGCFDAASGALTNCQPIEGMTGADGTKNLPAIDGASYFLAAFLPGAPVTDVKGATYHDGVITSNGEVISDQNPLELPVAFSDLTISGSFTSDDGNPIDHAGVNAERIEAGGTCSDHHRIGGHRFTMTDSGDYTIYVEEGTWLIEGHSPAGYACLVATVTSASLTGQTLVYDQNDSGRVSGEGQSGAFVAVHGPDGTNHTQIDQNGEYSVSVPLGDDYTVECHHPSLGYCGGQSLDVNGDEEVDFEEKDQGDFAIIDVTTLPHVFVDARDASGNGNGLESDPSGDAEVYVPAGTYRVRAGDPRFGDLCNAQSVTVAAGETVEVTCDDSDLSRTGKIRAQVVDQDGDNVPGASAHFISRVSKTGFLLTTSGDSSGYNLAYSSRPAAGEYVVLVNKEGYQPTEVEITLAADAATDITTPIVLTQATGEHGDTLTVSVKAEDSSPYTGISRVVAIKSDNGGARVVREVNRTTGEVELALTNGTWTVRGYGEGLYSDDATRTVTNGSLDSGTLSLTLSNEVDGVDGPQTHTDTFSSLKEGGISNPVGVDGLVSVYAPPGTLDTSDTNSARIETRLDTTLAHVGMGDGTAFVGDAGWEIYINDSEGNKKGSSLEGDPIVITVSYTDADVIAAGVQEDKLQLFSVNANGALETFPCVIDTVNNTLTCQVTHTSGFGILGGEGGGEGEGGEEESEEGGSPTNSGGGKAYLGVNPPVVPEAVEKTASEVVTIEAIKDQPVPFTVGASDHTLTIMLYDGVEVAVTIESVPVSVTLTPGQSQEVDTNADGILDLVATYNGLTDSAAHEFSFQNLTDEGEMATGFTIEAGRYETNSREVTLRFNVENAKEMLVSNHGDFHDVISYIPYVEGMPWTLTEGDGTKTVYIRYRSPEGGSVDVIDMIELVGQGFEQAEEVEEEASDDEQIGPVVPTSCALTPGHAYKSPVSPAVYYITEDCTKRPFTSPQIFFTYYDSWNDVRSTEQSILDGIPSNSIRFMPIGFNYLPVEGDLLKDVSQPKIYIVSGGHRRWLTTEAVFIGLDFAWDKVKDVVSNVLDKLPEGEAVNEVSEYAKPE